MVDNTILVTGATDGIGMQTALELGRMGHRVLVHGRDRRRGEAVLAQIKQESERDDHILVIADFASMRQVREMAERIREACARLDVLINNAGVFMPHRELTEDGFETTLAVNHLAPFLLTNLLIDRLRASAPARIVNVSSNTHRGARLNLDDLHSANGFDGYGAYASSKLANVLFTYALADRLAASGVTANCLHPGVIATKMLRAGWGGGGASLEEGAETPVYLATAPEVEGVTGKYFVNRKAVESASQSYDKRLQTTLWNISAQMVGIGEGSGEVT